MDIHFTTVQCTPEVCNFWIYFYTSQNSVLTNTYDRQAGGNSDAKVDRAVSRFRLFDNSDTVVSVSGQMVARSTWLCSGGKSYRSVHYRPVGCSGAESVPPQKVPLQWWDLNSYLIQGSLGSRKSVLKK